jgi:hypothetical protein
MTRAAPVRVLAAIMRPPADLVGFAVAVVGCAVFDALRRPRFFDECYGLALVFQMFSASTGFRERAVRGHFDPLLARHPRRSVAIAHLFVSAAFGAVVWAGVTMVDAVLVHGVVPTGIRAPAVSTFVCVSLIAWTAGLGLPRYGAGVIWLTEIVIVAGSGYASILRTAIADDPLWAHRLWHLAGVVGVPMLLLGGSPPASPLVDALVVLAAAFVAIGGILYVTRFDAVLEEVS